MESKKYPIGGYAPGNYSCTCCKCGTKFSGDKRAVECEQCAVSAKEKFDALSPDEQAEVIKRNIEEVNKAFSDWTKKPDVNLAIVGHGKPALYYPGSYYQPLFDLMRQEHGTILTESALTDIIEVVEKMRGKQPEPKWVKGALQWAKETIDFAWDYVKVPESLVETWGNMYMNTMHAIQQAQQEIEQPAAGREEDAVAFAEWLNSNFVSIENKEGEAVYVEYGPQEYDKKQQFKIGALYELFKQHNP